MTEMNLAYGTWMNEGDISLRKSIFGRKNIDADFTKIYIVLTKNEHQYYRKNIEGIFIIST